MIGLSILRTVDGGCRLGRAQQTPVPKSEISKGSCSGSRREANGGSAPRTWQGHHRNCLSWAGLAMRQLGGSPKREGSNAEPIPATKHRVMCDVCVGDQNKSCRVLFSCNLIREREQGFGGGRCKSSTIATHLTCTHARPERVS